MNIHTYTHTHIPTPRRAEAFYEALVLNGASRGAAPDARGRALGVARRPAGLRQRAL